MSPLIDTSDLCQKSRAGSRSKKTDRISKNDPVISTTGDDAADSEVKGTEESVEQQQQSPDLWVDRTFVKPMRALEELSSFTSLSCLMKILATVAVTGCSAERVMSRVKITKKQTA